MGAGFVRLPPRDGLELQVGVRDLLRELLDALL